MSKRITRRNSKSTRQWWRYDPLHLFHINTNNHSKLIHTLRKGASPFVKEILHIILYDMLVVEPRKTSLKPGPKGLESLPLATSGGERRITCIKLAQKLQPMTQEDDSYFTKPGPTAAEIITPPPQTLTIHESAVELVKRRSMTRSFSIEKNKQGGTKDEQQQRKGSMLDRIRSREGVEKLFPHKKDSSHH